MSDNNPFSLSGSSDENSASGTKSSDENKELSSELNEPIDSDSQVESSNTDNSIIRGGRDKPNKRKASYGMTDEEYQKERDRLDENASHKHYVFFVGMPGAGKSYVIASLLRHMTEYLEGTVSLDQDHATKVESTLYNRMLGMFDNPLKGIERTGSEDFHEYQLNFLPKDNSLKPISVTFIDTSGENLSRIYYGETSDYSGYLPDFINVILESNVNKMFVFVFDPDQSKEEKDDKEKVPQAAVLKSFYDLVLKLQQTNNVRYNKLLLLSKSDKLDQRELEKYDLSPSKWAQAPEHKISAFAQGFFNERNSDPRSQNSAIFYTLGKFNSRGLLEKFNNHSAEKLFNWIYKNITDQNLKKGPSLWQKFMSWFTGE